MDTNIASTASLESIEGEFFYLSPETKRPRNYTYDPPPGVPRNNAVYEPHRMKVLNARPVAAEASLDLEGFALVRNESAVRDFYDEDELRRVYYPEAERLVAEETGAERVIVFDHTVRKRLWGAEDRSPGTPRQPVGRVHNDYTERSGPQRVRDLMGDEAEALLGRRYEFINVWRPITGPLRDAPLGVCDARTVDPADWVPSELVYRDRTGETYAVRFNPAHRWWYVRDMMPNEALLLKCFDFESRRARPLGTALRVRGSDRPGRQAAARKHRAAHDRLPRRLT